MPEGVVGLGLSQSRSYFSAFSAKSRMACIASSLSISRMAMASFLVMGKKPPEISVERIQVEFLRLSMVLIDIAPFGAPFGFTNTKPIGCLIAGAFKPGSINKGFSQVDGMAVDGFPVI